MSEIYVKVVCPQCSKKHAIPTTYIGKVVLCQPCGKRFRVNEPHEEPITFQQAEQHNEYDLGASHIVDTRSLGMDASEVDLTEDDLRDIAKQQSQDDTIDFKVRLSATDIFDVPEDD
ncbi:MAG: hypothetical protein GC159_07440 [Phycisphaera sp.]|nr:hypothetical protein [Phycisphaera sp.]